jgi:hypothetical protein
MQGSGSHVLLTCLPILALKLNNMLHAEQQDY